MVQLISCIFFWNECQITDLPPGRIPVETYTIEGNDSGFEEIYKVICYCFEEGSVTTIFTSGSKPCVLYVWRI